MSFEISVAETVCRGGITASSFARRSLNILSSTELIGLSAGMFSVGCTSATFGIGTELLICAMGMFTLAAEGTRTFETSAEFSGVG